MENMASSTKNIEAEFLKTYLDEEEDDEEEHICGETGGHESGGCGIKFDYTDGGMFNNTSFCMACFEKKMLDEEEEELPHDYYINVYTCKHCGKRGDDDPDCSHCGGKMCVMLSQIKG
jgi:hypothetical protein